MKRSVFVITGIASASFSSSKLHLALFSLIKGFADTSVDETTCKKESGELILTAELFETYDTITGDTIHEANDSGKHLNLQLGNKEWALLSIDSHELALEMLLSKLLKMVVNDFASLKILVIEVEHAELGLRNGREELFLDDLSVFTVTLSEVFLKLFSLSLQLADALLTHGLHNCFVAIRVEIRIAVLALLLFLGFLGHGYHFPLP